MTIKKLSTMPYANAHVEIDDDNNISLFSYVTKVAEIDRDGWLTVNGLYSMTTRKHLGAFAKEYISFPCGTCGDYQLMKYAYENKCKFNILTGEIL